MGLLDDAIREHLDLKRRRGADPAEIERAEREALGPVRRAPEPQDAAEPEELAPGMPYDDHQATGVADHDELEWDEGFEDDGDEFEPFNHPSEEPLTVEAELPEPPPPRATRQVEEAPTQHMTLPDHDLEDDFTQPAEPAVPPPHPAAPAPADEPAPPAHRPADHLGGETVEYEIEDELADASEAKDEDVLEETPEFLQDTPDHDRLWFEQRPPRDFDFDD